MIEIDDITQQGISQICYQNPGELVYGRLFENHYFAIYGHPISPQEFLCLAVYGNGNYDSFSSVKSDVGQMKMGSPELTAYLQEEFADALMELIL